MIRFAETQYSVTEGASILLLVEKVGATAYPISVDLMTNTGSAGMYCYSIVYTLHYYVFAQECLFRATFTELMSTRNVHVSSSSSRNVLLVHVC